MADLKVLSGRTLLNKLGSLLYVSVLGAGIHGASLIVSNAIENNRLNGRAEVVQEAIQKNDFNLASQLLTSFQEKNLMREEDKIRLDLKLKDKIRLNLELEKNRENWKEIQGSRKTLDSLINLGKIEDARLIFNELKGVYTLEEISKIESFISGLTEQGLYKRCNFSTGLESMKLAEKYLKLYPSGPNRKKVIEIYLTNSTLSFLNNINSIKQSKGEFVNSMNSAYQEIFNFNLILEKYAHEGISLSDMLDYNSVYKHIDSFIEDVREIPQKPKNNNIFIGSKVKVDPQPSVLTGFSELYVKNRDSMILPGSIGKVIGGKYQAFQVELSRGGPYDYHPSELRVIDGDDNNNGNNDGKNIQHEIGKNRFKREIGRLKKNFSYYK